MKFINKKLVSLITVIFLLSIVTSAFAATDGYPRTAGWDYVGEEYWHIDGTAKWGDIHYSTGGDFEITVDGHTPFNSVSNPYLIIYVYENDGSGINNYVTSFTYFPDSYVDKSFVLDARGLIDGANNEAEIIIQYDSNYIAFGSTTVWYYD